MFKSFVYFLVGFALNIFLCNVFSITNPLISWYHFLSSLLN